MKNLLNIYVKGALFVSFVFAVTLFFSSCSKDAGGSATVGITYSLSGNASGSQAVPASSNPNGSGNMSGTYNSGTKVMSYTTTWTNLTSAPLAGGLYIGGMGETGSSFYAWSFGSGLGTSGSITATTTLNADQEA